MKKLIKYFENYFKTKTIADLEDVDVAMPEPITINIDDVFVLYSGDPFREIKVKILDKKYDCIEDEWVKYIFIDTGTNIAHTKLTKDFLKIYKRVQVLEKFFAIEVKLMYNDRRIIVRRIKRFDSGRQDKGSTPNYTTNNGNRNLNG